MRERLDGALADRRGPPHHPSLHALGAIGLIVPLVGGLVAYLFLRRQLAGLRLGPAGSPTTAPPPPPA